MQPACFVGAPNEAAVRPLCPEELEEASEIVETSNLYARMPINKLAFVVAHLSPPLASVRRSAPYYLLSVPSVSFGRLPSGAQTIDAEEARPLQRRYDVTFRSSFMLSTDGRRCLLSKRGSSALAAKQRQK